MTDLSVASLPDKRLVAVSFSRAAASYDSVAELQRNVGHELMSRLPVGLSPQRWLDVGCGTGYFSRVLGQHFPRSEGLALDIAQGMLAYARPLGGAQHFIAGDAECLPLQDNSCDVVFSSLALQWCAHFDGWKAVDGQVHVNRFREFSAYQQLCAGSGLQVKSLHTQPHVLHYPQVRQLTHELKALGAHNLNPGRPEGLTGRARVQGLITAYEQFRQPQGLPATYQVVYGILEKAR